MAGAKHGVKKGAKDGTNGGTKNGLLHCGMCDGSFDTKAALTQHQRNHPDVQSEHLCNVCNWPFSDSLQLEAHEIQAGHGQPAYQCPSCSQPFPTSTLLAQHRKFPKPCSDAFRAKEAQNAVPESTLQYYPASETVASNNNPKNYNLHCAKCQESFRSQARFDLHGLACRPRNSASAEVDPPKFKTLKSVYPPGFFDRPVKVPSEEGEMADVKVAPKPAQPRQTDPKPNLPKQPEPRQTDPKPNLPKKPELRQTEPKPTQPTSSPSPHPSTAASTSAAETWKCGIGGCQKTTRSEAAIKQHRQDTHGVGGEGLDFAGKDSWMLTQRARDQLKNAGCLRPSPEPSHSPVSSRTRASLTPRPIPQSPLTTPKRSNLTPGAPSALNQQRAAPQGLANTLNQPRPTPQGPASTLNRPIRIPRGPSVTLNQPRITPQGPSSTNRPHLTPRRPSAAMNRAPPQGPPVSTPPPPAAPVGGGPADMEQVSFICGKMLPLLLQADVTIYHDGKVTYNGIDWRRIGSGMQANAIGMVGKLCHLPVKLQGEYLPSPQTFRDEYSAQYSAEDFAASPSRSPATSGYPVIALSCSKIVLADGCQEVVKIAAIDVLTCRILMHHLVCPDPKATVKNWQTGITGLSRFSDIEAARQAGYKVLKGWQAARAALWKLITKDTIIIGHNLRSDLDALRMIHGRAVDVAKSVEKAADGPLSKTQLSLDSLSRDFNGTALTTHRTFGRDCLQDAFAARGLCLCIIKDGDAVARRARRMSLDYQVVVNSTTGV